MIHYAGMEAAKIVWAAVALLVFTAVVKAWENRGGPRRRR